ncbi:hypothetical protein FYK55_07055 [Roseiconus nitratireducens]|uniref:Uncharacterized protein n=1 Tax=Roseiconus nitratireducens TaxID=2605748 RepID=A0A5M6DGI0_9BACT|nr:hypothetical protein [Roseiconus nitratireducens]KAA5545402.1 hypothetical protein FYK55_07055 [Roseiconus nitratireducens]
MRLLRSWSESRVRLGRWEELRSGIADLRPIFVDDYSQDWFRLMLLILDEVSWEKGVGAIQVRHACWQEVESMSYLHLKFCQQLMRYDEYPKLVTAIDRIGFLGQHWVNSIREAVREGWRRSAVADNPRMLPQGLQSFATQVVVDPAKALRDFDAIAQTSVVTGGLQRGQATRGTVLLSYLNKVFRTTDDASSRQPESDLARIKSFFDYAGPIPYAKLRGNLMRFCLDEVIRPRDILKMLHRNPARNDDGTDVPLSDSLADDASLMLVIQVHDRVGVRGQSH